MIFLDNIKELIIKVKRKFYYRHNIYSKNLSQSKLVESKVLGDSFVIEKIGWNHKDLLIKYANENRGKDHFQKNLKSRLDNNERFVGFAVINIENNEIAYLSWIDLKMLELNDANYKIKLKNSQAYFFDDHCLPIYRRKGLHKMVFEKRLNYCIEINTEEVLITIMSDNKKAINNLFKFDFKIFKKIDVFPFLKMKNWF